MTALRACLAASAATLALVSTAAIVVSIPTARYDDATLRAHIAASDKLASVHQEVLSHSYCNENNRKKYDCYKLLEFVDAAVHSMVDGKYVAPDTYALTETTNVVIRSNVLNNGKRFAESDVPVVELTSIISNNSNGSTQSTEPLFVTLEEASSEIPTCFVEQKYLFLEYNTQCECREKSALKFGVGECGARFVLCGYWKGPVTVTLNGDVFTCNPPACDASMRWGSQCSAGPGMNVGCDHAFFSGYTFYSDSEMAKFDSGSDMYSCS